MRRQSGSAIPPKLRTVLMLIDGRTPFESFRSTLQTYGDVTRLFSILRDLGLIVRASSSDYVMERNRTALSQPPAPANDDAQARYDARARQSSSPVGHHHANAQHDGAHCTNRASGDELRGTCGTGGASPRPAPAYVAPAAPPAPPAPSASDEKRRSELESIKAGMIRDVSVVLGADAGPVMSKIQCCRTHDDLFAFMMGIKKVISIYADRAKADQFASRYEALSR